MKGTLKKILASIAIPLSVFVFFSILTMMEGNVLFENFNHVRTFVNAFVVTTFVAWALSLNLHTGRFDFSLGSVSILASILGVQVMWRLEDMGITTNAWIMIVVIIFFGLILGFLSGMAYIILKMPAIVTSLGVTLIYEGFAFMITDGAGVLLNRSLHLTRISDMQNQLIILGIGFIIIYFITNKTKFGFNWRSLVAGQKISVETGICEKKNAVLSYTIAGALASVGGAFNMGMQGTASASLNFTTITLIFIAFLPLFIGGLISRFVDKNIGIMLGAFTTALITLGFVRLGVSMQMQSFWNAIILLLFLVYLNNEMKIIGAFTKVFKQAQSKKTLQN